ncbi:hypothetical protein BDV25DRAFT_157074 [Aspergillus avenaceus]|uniref:Uncharacterized protein n=1 Tax=Aspergillus avenaceus TaxID=36643 RepID=A0A5N6TRS7_ASPAV|nr:hypothetical protein BDV25DRAFT_157074 [Aspergillus avenaceus]
MSICRTHMSTLATTRSICTAGMVSTSVKTTCLLTMFLSSTMFLRLTMSRNHTMKSLTKSLTMKFLTTRFLTTRFHTTRFHTMRSLPMSSLNPLFLMWNTAWSSTTSSDKHRGGNRPVTR